MSDKSAEPLREALTRAELKARDLAITDEEYRLRSYLALSHQDGKCYIYGDDGELQCGNLLRHGRTIDFRREPIADLLDVIERTRMIEYAKEQEGCPICREAGKSIEEALKCGSDHK